jgi:glycosyltransferase involved in cell wall biosynthesis
MNASGARTTLIHDWLVGYAGGGERVLEQMIELYPDSALHTAIDTLAPAQRDFLHGKRPIVSFAQRVPGVARYYRACLPLLMFAMEQLDLSEYELVLSSSVSVARGVLTGPDQLHIAYVHSPMRYAWEMQHEYLREAHLERGLRSLLARWMLHRARFWDLRTANGVDYFVANSHFIARRIWKVYRRHAAVIHPPVDVERFTLRTRKDDFYLTASRLVPYKKIATVVEAFRLLPDRRLVVIGAGPEMARIKAAAAPNVELLGYQPSAVLCDLMQRARAFVFAAQEDFGIAPIEAQACGTPVIAYGRGGALESVRPPGSSAPTGLFFDAQTAPSIAAAVRAFERDEALFDPQACRDNAQRFSSARFRAQYGALVQRCWEAFRSGRLLPESAVPRLDVVRARAAGALDVSPVGGPRGPHKRAMT